MNNDDFNHAIKETERFIATGRRGVVPPERTRGMKDIQTWLDQDPQRCAWCPEPAHGHAWHNDYALHPSCGQIGHGEGWVPDEGDRLPQALKALQAVLDMHRRSDYGGCAHTACDSGSAWPCPTVETIQDTIGDKRND